MRKLSSFLVLLGLCAMPALAAAATYDMYRWWMSTAPKR